MHSSQWVSLWSHDKSPFRDFLALYLNCAIIAISYRWNLISVHLSRRLLPQWLKKEICHPFSCMALLKRSGRWEAWHSSQLLIVAGILEWGCNLCVHNFALPSAETHPSTRRVTRSPCLTFLLYPAHLRLCPGVLLLDLWGFWTESCVLI